jgi:hypothetical protein
MPRTGVGHRGRGALAWAVLAVLAAFAILAAPLAGAGTFTGPEVADGSGDVPAGLGWADVRKAWFSRDGDRFTLRILVAGPEAIAAGEVGVAFRIGDRHYIAGYSAIPGAYSGGFLGPADEEGRVAPGTVPTAMAGQADGGLYTVSFARQDLPADADAFEDPWAWSEARAASGAISRLDRSEVGRDFTWGDPAPEPAVAASAGGSGRHESPLPVTWAFLAVATAATLAASRRR